MNNPDSDSPEQLEIMIEKGYGLDILPKLEKILSSKKLSSENVLTYVLLKCRALMLLSRYYDAAGFLDEYWQEFQELGTIKQKLDLLIFKAEILGVFGKGEECIILIDEAERILKTLKDDESFSKQLARWFNVKIMNIFRIEGNVDEQLNFVEKMLIHFRKTDNVMGISYALDSRRYIKLIQLKKEEALVDIKEIIDLAEKEGNILRRARGLNKLGGFYAWFDDVNQALQYLDESHKILLETNHRTELANLYNTYLMYYTKQGDLDTVQKYAEKSYEIYKEIGYKFEISRATSNLGFLYLEKLEYDKASSFFYESLALAKDMNNYGRYHRAQSGLTSMFIRKGELNRAIKFLKESIQYFKGREDAKQNYATSIGELGNLHLLRGETDLALDYFNYSLEYWEKRDYSFSSIYLNKIGSIYHLKGNYKIALEYFHKSEKIAEKNKLYIILSEIYLNIINCCIDTGNNDKVKGYLNLFKDLEYKADEKLIRTRSKLANAIFLGESRKNEDVIKSKEICQNMLKEENMEYSIVISSILNICKLLIIELKKVKNEELLTELKTYVERLEDMGAYEFAYPLITQSLWLQAQIALLEMDVMRARNLLNKAQALAEEKELELIALKISNSHDNLLEKLEDWEIFTQRLPSIVEIMGITHIESILEEMIIGKGIVISNTEMENEDPSFLIILSESGSIIYTEQFQINIKLEIIDQISTQIVTKLQDGIRKEVIERMFHQSYTYLIKQLDKVIFCYAFIGKSFKGLRKLNEFSTLVQKNDQVWNNLINISSEKQSLDQSTRFILNQFIDHVFH
jgi:tetratricopeptide (TPR) repeat protein